MSTSESNNHTATNGKMQSNLINSTSSSIHPLNSQPQTPSPPPLAITYHASVPPSPAQFNEDKHGERFQKKGKQILFEFDQIVKGIDHFLLLPSSFTIINECEQKDIKFERAKYTYVLLPLYTYVSIFIQSVVYQQS
ncbi:unnamed protein product [Adineta ricciae]|uniref:Uncharacterized protein n=1 Tax=Adineta ricciae TaxID=249248 RepID=A0A816AX71_ADIRI|nr:unnamed protein product [Adineta ricciae]